MRAYLAISLVLVLLLAGCPGGGTAEQSCPDTEQLVCGADGITYTNPCFAHKAGVSVAHEGSCTTPLAGCADGDGGKDIFVAGSTLGPEGNYQDDYCKDKDTVMEYFCDAAGEIAYAALPCPGGYICLQGACVVAPCEDSDTGIKPGEKGTVTSGNEEETDTCEDETTLKEFFCKDGAISFELMDCPANEHCVDGACVEYECVDSDEGEDAYESGTVTKGDLSNTDSCYSSTTVKEYYCEDGIIKSKNIACESDEECVEGVCVDKATCVDTDGGEDKFTVGTTSYEDTSYTDTCYSDATVLEYYCDGTEIKSKTLVCGVGYECVAGKCVEEECEEEALDEEPVRYEMFSDDDISLYKGDLVEVEVGSKKYMLKLKDVNNASLATFALYDDYADYLENDDICNDEEINLDDMDQDICGKEVDLDLTGINTSDDFVEISTGKDFNIVQYFVQEGTTYTGSGCPDDEIDEETSLFYPPLTATAEDNEFKMLGEDATITEVDLADKTISIEFEGDDYEFEDDTFEYNGIDYEVNLYFNDGGLYKLVVKED